MIIKTNISFKKYLKLLFRLIYKKAIMKLILFVDFVMIVWIVGYYSNIFPFPEPTIYQFITLVLITIVQPVVIFKTVWRNYKSSNHLSEQLKIEITASEIKLQGESFYTEIKWIKIFKIVELNNWFLIYENTFSAIIIPKNAFQEGELIEFVNILKGIKGVTIKLKK